MRGVALSLVVCGLVACSRNPPPQVSSEPAAPVAKEDRREPVSTLRLASAVEEASDAGATPAPAPAAPTTDGKTVLHVGDSMVGGDWGLTKALEKKFTAEGAKFVHETKVSESIVSFDKSSRLKELLAKHKPDIVILTLGTNDVFVPYPAALAPNVQNIAKRMGNRECFWMGPPLWKPDTGIVAVIKDNAAPCKFYDASNLKLDRGKDGIHPTDAGGQVWATEFWKFFKTPATEATDAGLLPTP